LLDGKEHPRPTSRENSVFNTQNPQKSKIESLLKKEGEAKDFSHLSDFLKG